MTKFRHKKTGKIVEENLIYYVEKLRNNSNYKEIPIQKKTKEENKEVEEEKPLQ